MTKVIDYYLTLNSPYAYLGSQCLEAIAGRHGAQRVENKVYYRLDGGALAALAAPKA